MRKVTKTVVGAFLKRQPEQVGNTRCDSDSLYLHNNKIAQWRNGELWITSAGWKTVTTKERLNALPNVRIHQDKGVWYLNGKPWSGDWTNVSI